jgi:hypothetical protein
MRPASKTVGGVPSVGLALKFPLVLTAVMVLGLGGGAASSGPRTQLAQTAQQQKTLTADDLKALQQKAEQGDAEAQFMLGIAYIGGLGVPQDSAQAFQWIRKAALQGNASGQSGLGAMYEGGNGVTQDYAQAAAWYRKAAEQGAATAQALLGKLYRDGKGIPQDSIEALKWTSLAAGLRRSERKTQFYSADTTHVWIRIGDRDRVSGGSVGVMGKPDVRVKRRMVDGVGRWAGVVRGEDEGGGRCAPPRLRGGARPGGRVRASTGPAAPPAAAEAVTLGDRAATGRRCGRCGIDDAGD